MLRQRGARLRLHRLVLVGLIGLLLSGCRVFSTPSLRPLPLRERFGNPWSPEANARREANGICVHSTPEMEQWAEFGRQWLLDGDLLMRRGCTSKIPGLDVSRVLAGVADSPFSHIGIVVREEDQVWIYDTEGTGPHKIPFEHWMLDVYQNLFVIKRLREPYRDRIPQILAYCEMVYQTQVPFDFSLAMDDDALYCAEMIEKAFASAGLTLSEPIPLCCLPNYQHFRCLASVLELVSDLRVSEPVYGPGNATYGIYASPLLETVYETPEVFDPKWSQHNPPRCSVAHSEE